MNILIFIFNFLVIIMVTVKVLKASKSFKRNNRMFDNIEGLVRQRYNSLMQNNINSSENKVVNDVDTSVNLDDFMKSNSNPIKEARGKRSKI